MKWYERSFGKDYLLIYPHRNEEEAKVQIEFLMRHIKLPENAKILDLCCGTGRHLLELKKLGYDVVGLDLSPELLDIASEKARELGLDVSLVRCDMRDIPYEDTFDLIIQFFTSFGYFDSDEENQEVLASIAKALKPKGKLLLDYLNPQYVRKNLVKYNESRISDDILIVQKRWIDEVKKRVNKEVTIFRDKTKSTYIESVRLYELREIEAMLKRSGLNIDELYGDFSDLQYDENSPRMIIIAHKVNP